MRRLLLMLTLLLCATPAVEAQTRHAMDDLRYMRISYADRAPAAGDACIAAGGHTWFDTASKLHYDATDCTPGAEVWQLRGTMEAALRIQEEGTTLTERGFLNFLGGGMTCVDNAAANRTDCDLVDPPASLVVDIRDHGAIANDSLNDHVAIQAAINAAPNGSTIYFPAGVWQMGATSAGLVINNRQGLTFAGDGWQSVLKRTSGAGDNRMATVTSSSDFTVRDMAFDANGITTFGGFVFHGGNGTTPNTRVRIHNTRYFDGAVDGGTANDRYPWVMTGSGNTFFWFHDNLIEDLQLEIDSGQYVQVYNNVIRRPRWYACIGVFSQAGAPPGASHYFIHDNVCEPAHSIPGAIAVVIDPPTGNSKTFEHFVIARNTIRMLGVKADRAFYIGTTDSSIACTNNFFQDFQIVDNEIWVDPAITTPAGDGFFFNGSSSCTPNLVFERFRVAGNRVISLGTSVLDGMDLRSMRNSRVTGNTIQGATGNGLSLNGSSNTQMDNNLIIGTPAIGYRFASPAAGGNRSFGNRLIGTPITAVSEVVSPRDDDYYEDILTTQTISTASGTANQIRANTSVRQLNVTANVTMTTAPTIMDGVAPGQLLRLVNTGTNTITLQDQDTLANSNVQLRAASLAIAPNESRTFVWNGTDWLEN